MKKDRSYMMIKISFIMIIISFVTLYGTNAFFADSEELKTNINITTGTLDIQLKDSNRNTVGDQSYILNLDQTTKSQMIGNLSVKDIGTLSSNLSAKVIVGGLTNMVSLFKILIIDSTGKETPLSENYKLISSVFNVGTTFGVKVLYSGTLPINYSGLVIKVVFRATQPNDDLSSPKMFTDMQEIRFDMPQNIQIAFGDGIPIDGTVIIEHKNDAVIKLLPIGLDIESVVTSFNSSQFSAVYDAANQIINVHVNGNNNSAIIKITIKFKNGQTYVIERDIKSTN